MAQARLTKRVPKTKQTENRGIIAVHTFANDMGWAWRPTPNDDYGIDGELEPCTDGKPSGRIIKIQIKSGRSYMKKDCSASFEYQASPADLEYWRHVNVPVLLVVHDPEARRTYIIEVNGAIAADPSIRRTQRIRFDKQKNLLTAQSEAELLALANGYECTGRIFRRAGGKHSERLHSNLLAAYCEPEYVYGAPTDCRNQQEIRDALGDRRKTPAIASDGMLWTFADLNHEECSLRGVCDTKKIVETRRTEWADGSDRRNLLVQLMNTCLRKMLAARELIFDQDKGRYYFPPLNGAKRELKWKSLVKQITHPVAYPHVVKVTGVIDYWVHWSAKFRFMFFGTQLYLMVEPCMVFTRDGEALVGGEEMGRLSTSRSSHQYNRSVLGYSLFWKEFLKGDRDSIVVYPAPPPQTLAFFGEYVSGGSDFGIEGDKVALTSVAEDLDDIDLSLEPDEHDSVEDEEETDEHDDD